MTKMPRYGEWREDHLENGHVKKTVFLRIKKIAKQLVSVFLKVLWYLYWAPTSPTRKGNFSREYYPYTMATNECFVSILGVTQSRKFDSML